jgi:hypothetical protein
MAAVEKLVEFNRQERRGSPARQMFLLYWRQLLRIELTPKLTPAKKVGQEKRLEVFNKRLFFLADTAQAGT